MRSPSSRRSGFTLIELIVVMSIILILAGMLYVAFKYVGAPAKRDATRTTLKNLQSMMANWEVENNDINMVALGASLTPPGAPELPTPLVQLPAPADPWWQQPFTSSGAKVLVVGPWAGVSAVPALPLDETFPLGRHGPAVVVTQRVMAKLLAIPANRDLLSKIPPEHLMTVMWQANIRYLRGDHVGVLVNGQIHRFVCISPTSPPIPGTSPANDATNWALDTQPVPVLLDNWDNPILFVPAQGLAGVVVGTSSSYNGATAYKQGDRATYGDPGSNVPIRVYTCINPAGVTNVLPPTVWPYSDGVNWGGVCSPEVRPFFVSAGPDGAFGSFPGADGNYGTGDDGAAGDDNEYSFSN